MGDIIIPTTEEKERYSGEILSLRSLTVQAWGEHVSLCEECTAGLPTGRGCAEGLRLFDLATGKEQGE